MLNKIKKLFNISLETALGLLVVGMFILGAASREPTNQYTPEFDQVCVNAYDC